MPKCLPLCAVLFALFSCGASIACEHCALDDDVALHQHALHLRPLAGEAEAAPALTTPSKSNVNRIRPLIKAAADGVLKRTTAKLKLPTIPAVFRWELVGKVTSWAVGRYQKPKSEAALGLLDEIIDLAADVLGSKEIASMEDAELSAKLGDITRLHQMAQHYIEKAGAPAAVHKLVDMTAEAAKAKGKMDPDTAAQALIDVANETSGPALADLFAYMKKVGEGKEQLDSAHLMDLHVPVLSQFGAPPAVTEYLRTTADMERQKVARDPTAENVRSERMLAEASRQLGMPSAIPETLDFIADTISSASTTHIFEKKDEIAKMLAHLNELQAKLNDQLGGPAAVSELIRRCNAPLLNETVPDAAEIFSLFAQASKQLSFPGAVAEFFEYIGPIAAKGSAPEPERMQTLILQLSEQVGAPEAFAKFGKDAAALAKKNGGALDPAKFLKLVTQLLRKLGMPAFADIFGKLGGPVLKGKTPDPLALAAVAPSLMKVLPDFETANGLANDMRAKLMKPLMPVYENAVQKLTGNMPESTMKSAFKQALSLARPPA